MHFLRLLLSWPYRRRLHDDLAASLREMPRPLDRTQVRTAGHRPLHVLILGSGLAVGHGVARREDALDGHLARQLTQGTGRGVVVNNLAQADNALADQIWTASLSETLDLEDVILWVPSSMEVCSRLWPRSWASRLTELLEFAARSRHVVVLTLPVRAAGSTEAARTGIALAQMMNDDLRRVALAFPNVSVVDPPAVVISGLGRLGLHEAYYADLATSVVRELVPALLEDRASAARS